MNILKDENGFELHLEDAPRHPGKRRLLWRDQYDELSDMIFSDGELEMLRKHLNAAHEKKKGG